MNNLPLQPLKWDGDMLDTPLHTYQYLKDCDSKGKYMVKYAGKNRSLNEPARGFATIDEAKAWAWKHYNEKMKPYVKPDPLTEYATKFTQWATDRKIIQNGNLQTQTLKLVSEVGELADNIAKGRDTKDDIGDSFVVLNNLVEMQGYTWQECLEQAWGDIRYRKGVMNEHGVFIKYDDVGK